MIMNQQYYIYGTIVSYEWLERWKKEKGDKLSEVIDKINNSDNVTEDDISCVFYGRDGKSLIIGKILKVFGNDEAIQINELNDDEKKIIEDSVITNYNLKTEFNHYYIKTYDKI